MELLCTCEQWHLFLSSSVSVFSLTCTAGSWCGGGSDVAIPFPGLACRLQSDCDHPQSFWAGHGEAAECRWCELGLDPWTDSNARPEISSNTHTLIEISHVCSRIKPGSSWLLSTSVWVCVCLCHICRKYQILFYSVSHFFFVSITILETMLVII